MAKLINFNDKGKWGYYNSETHTIIPAQFQKDSDFVNGLAIVKKCSNSRYGVIDENGYEIMPFIFDLIERQDNGLFKAGTYFFNCLYNHKGEIVDADGVVIEEKYQKYDVVKKSNNGLCLVREGNVQKVLYHDVPIMECDDKNDEFTNIFGYSSFFLLDKDIFNKGIPFSYHGERLFSNYRNFKIISEKYIIYSAGYGKGYGIFDMHGSTILSPKYFEIKHEKGSIFCLNYKIKPKDKDNLILFDAELKQFIVKNGDIEIFIPNTLDWCGNFNEGFAIAVIDHKFGVIDINGNICVDCIYDEVELGNNKSIVVKSDGKSILIDFDEKKNLAVYNNIHYLSDGFFLFEEHFYCGILNDRGTIIVPAKYNYDICPLDDGTFRVSKGNYKYTIDKEDHVIIKTTKGKIQIPNEIICTWEFCDGLVILENIEGKLGVVDEYGNERIPCIFNGNIDVDINGHTEIIIDLGEEEQFLNWLDNRIFKDKNVELYYDFNVQRIIKYESYTITIISNYSLSKNPNSDGIIVVKNNNGLWGLVDAFAHVVKPCMYDRIYDFNNGYFVVSKGNKDGIIDKCGKEIVPLRDYIINLYKDGLFSVLHRPNEAHIHYEFIIKRIPDERLFNP